MNKQSLDLLIKDVLSKKSPEKIASESKHGDLRWNVLDNIPLDALTKASVSLDKPVANTLTPLVEIMPSASAEVDIRKTRLQALIADLKIAVSKEVKQRKGRGQEAANKYAQVFELLCQEYLESDIARTLKITRERVRQIKEHLKTLNCMRNFYKELRGDYRGVKW